MINFKMKKVIKIKHINLPLHSQKLLSHKELISIKKETKNNF